MSTEHPLQGEIWLVSLEPTIGSEIGKTRPAVVISNNRNNQFAETVTVIPITSKTEKIYPFEVFLPRKDVLLSQDSKAKANQIRTIDKKRLLRPLAKLPETLLREVKQAVLIHLGIEKD
ncbi:MAG: type II toxin-antitoxin system PemK/MazF family toxin [Candidatus Aminicenantales bacterium]